MGRQRGRRSRIGFWIASALTVAAIVVGTADFADWSPQLNVSTICLVVLAVAMWQEWHRTRARAAAAEAQRQRDERLDRHINELRANRSRSDSDR